MERKVVENMSKPVVKEGKGVTKIEIGSKRYKISKILLIITICCFALSAVIDLVIKYLEK